MFLTKIVRRQVVTMIAKLQLLLERTEIILKLYLLS